MIRFRQRTLSSQTFVVAAVFLLATAAGALAVQPFAAVGTIQWLADKLGEPEMTLRGAGLVVVALAAGQAALAVWLVASRGAPAARWATIAAMVVLSAPLVYLAGWGQDAGCGCLGGINLFADAQWNAGAGLARNALVAVLMAPGRQQLAKASPDSSPVNC